MSIALAGCLVGAMVSGSLADRLGRKPLLLLSALIFLISAYATGVFNDFYYFLSARFGGGIAIGIASGLSPMYIAEIAPGKIRGKLVSLNQLTIVLGILGAQIVNYLIAEPMPAGTLLPAPDSWNALRGWRWMFWSAAFPAALFLLLVFFIPESPRWLVMKGRVGQARKILAAIGGERYAEAEIQSVSKGAEKKAWFPRRAEITFKQALSSCAAPRDCHRCFQAMVRHQRYLQLCTGNIFECRI